MHFQSINDNYVVISTFSQRRWVFVVKNAGSRAPQLELNPDCIKAKRVLLEKLFHFPHIKANGC